MLRRAATISLLAGVFAASAAAAPKVQLMPGVTYEKGVQFTSHGPVAVHVLTAPKPGGLYALRPVLSNETILGKETISAMQRRISSTATVAGVNGDLFNWNDGHPSGVLMRSGVLDHPPLSDRSSIGVDSSGGLHVDRVKFFGTWKGLGQRRPLNGLNEVPDPGEVVLFTSAWGPATPVLPGVTEVVMTPFPATVPNVDLAAIVTAVDQTGGAPIPPGAAVLMARGGAAPKLLAEAPVGTAIASRLILQPDWTGITDAIGGGPVIVRNAKPVFRSFEGFTTDQLLPRNPRTGVGQLADGRIIFLTVDGRQPGYSAGLTNFELAQTLTRLGAVTGSALDAGGSTTLAFDGKVLNRPSDPSGERPVAEMLAVLYYGVYAPPPSQPLVGRDTLSAGEQLAYKVVRPSTVNASLIPPDKIPRPIEAEAVKAPGTYRFPITPEELDQEGTWHWNVQVTDDQGVASTIDRAFQVDLTLSALRVPRVASRKVGVPVRFTLQRPANVALRIETRLGTILRTLPPRRLSAGAGVVRWDARLKGKTKAFPGTYVMRVVATSEIGTMNVQAPFTLRK